MCIRDSNNGGSIVTLGSIYGSIAPDFSIYEGTNMTSPPAYSAIKGGVSAFSKYLSSYYGLKKVRVNKVFDRLNQRYGSGTICIAKENYERFYITRRKNLSPAYTSSFNELPSVS